MPASTATQGGDVARNRAQARKRQGDDKHRVSNDTNGSNPVAINVNNF